LKSAHLSEFLHGNGGNEAEHHHHDPYYTDENDTHRYYSRPGGGYEGQGFDHGYKDLKSGNYGVFNADYNPSGYEAGVAENAWGLYKGDKPWAP